MNVTSNNISFSYDGFLNPKDLENLLNDVIKYLDENIRNTLIRKRIYVVTVEALENIIKHSDKDIQNKYKVKYYLNCKEKEYILKFINLIHCSNADKLKTILSNFKNKSKVEIKELYKTTITKATISSKGGAGLGLIEIAKVSNNINYKFNNIENDMCEFILEVKFDL